MWCDIEIRQKFNSKIYIWNGLILTALSRGLERIGRKIDTVAPV